MSSELMDLFFLKTELWERRLTNLKLIKSPPWTLCNLEKALSSLKNNKTVDPIGMVNELFKKGCIGDDLLQALLILYNGMKNYQTIPHFVTLENITTIYKNKGSRMDLNNDRGIFILTVLKKILDKLIYFDNYDEIDRNMSD